MSSIRRGGHRKSRDNNLRKRCPELGYYYIVTDTDKTEKNYLLGLRNTIPKNLSEKIVIKVIKSKTVGLIKTCREGTSLHPQYSEGWIVFDRDLVKDFDDIIINAEENSINVAWSNPCFEVWLFAYLGDIPNIHESVTCCQKFSKKYEKIIGKKYEKAAIDIYKSLSEHSTDEEAIEIAERARKQCLANGFRIPSKMVPCTTVDILVKEIKNKIDNKV